MPWAVCCFNNVGSGIAILAWHYDNGRMSLGRNVIPRKGSLCQTLNTTIMLLRQF